MQPFIFLHGLTLNMEAYINWLEEVVLPWIEKMATGRPYIPCHTSNEKISVTTSLQTSGCLIPQFAIPMIIIYGG